MKIAMAELQMFSEHYSLEERQVRESLKFWTGNRRPDFEGNGRRESPPMVDRVTLSDAGKAATVADEIDDTVEQDPRTRLIRSMLEALTGQVFRVFDRRTLTAADDAQVPAGSAPVAPPPAGFGLEYDYHASYTEIETTRFSTQGQVRTADGQTVNFQLEMEMSRVFHEESSVSLRLGDAARKVDPLVLNFAGTAASLQDERFSFDLDADGVQDRIARLAQGNAYLVFDRNRDGQVNDGRELFGPASGDGFQELSRLDEDRNGWIDENDTAFTQLQLWQPGAQAGGEMKSLTEAGVGALALARLATPFDLKDPANQSLGQVRSSGVFLHEDGRAGSLQQIDLSV